MKQVVADLRSGGIEVRDVPAPAPRAGFVLVRTTHSLISAGTEGATVRLGKLGALGKARARPEQAMKLFDLARKQGPLTAWQVAQRALDMPVALGYSCAGVVEAMGDGTEGLRVGQRVACAGQGWASHAEFVSVPRRLCVPLPDAVSGEHGAFATVGAIALQSLRIADVRLGETIVVVGLGLIGLLVAQLARASGCQVIGLDIDPRRVAVFDENSWGNAGSVDGNAAGFVSGLTQGVGADAVIVTAATDDPGPVALAGELCRRKGRVVVVGRTPMVAPRETFLFKELSLLTSMAYGPGTGDPRYEVGGHDYPLHYVRFTEERNIVAFLAQIESRRIDLGPLVTHRYPVTSAPEAFAALDVRAEAPPIGIVLEYDSTGSPDEHRRVNVHGPKTDAPARTSSSPEILRVGVIGAGSFATHELLPLLKSLPVELRTIASLTGVRAEALARSHGFGECTSDADVILRDPSIDAVLILTRHDTHADLARRALDAGKHVFVEKPLALNHAELERVRQAQQQSGKLLMVGFNRRYAPLAVQLKQAFLGRTQPMFVRYLANVGLRPPEHWLHHAQEGGGVIVGEACHHLDFCCWVVDRPVSRVDVHPLGTSRPGLVDSVSATLSFDDGSLATVGYLSNGHPSFPTESVEVLCAGDQAQLLDFRSLKQPGRWIHRTKRFWLGSDKGHGAQLRHFCAAAAGTEASFDVGSYLRSSALAIDVADAAHRTTAWHDRA